VKRSDPRAGRSVGSGPVGCVVVRRPDASQRDGEALAIRDVMQDARRGALPGLRETHSADEAFAFVREVVLATQSVWLAEAGGRIVGFAARKDTWLMHLYVAPGWSGRGIGTQLLERVLRESPSLELWTFARNDGARRFYERHGFVAVEFGDGGDNEEGEADVRYVRLRDAPPPGGVARMTASRRAPSRSR
jgi:GNAT superfamily N-acetyltransferase